MADRLYSVVFLVFVIITFSQPSWGSLFGLCSSVANCTDVNATCKLMGDDMRCVCDDVTQYDHESTCLEKGATGSSCPSSIDDVSKPCLDLNAICQNVNTNYRCECKTGYTLSNGDCVKPDCGELQNPSNGAVSISGTGFEATATYTCTTSGYLITGTTSDTITRTCSIGGWSGSLPTCSLKDCGGLASPSNGAVSAPSGTVFGATATYSCTTNGYLITGTSSVTITRTCLIDGWSGSEPTCTIKDCGGLANPSYGTVSTTGESFGETATYICINGYFITGASSNTSTRTCTINGWSGSEHTCSIKDCGDPLNPSNGRVTYEATTYQAEATYTCNSAYIVDGATSNTITITCTSNGDWSTEFPSCSVDAEPLGARCLNPADTSATAPELCNGVNALCDRKTTSGNEFTCQCTAEFYDDNGNNAAGICKPISDLQVQSITFASVSTFSMIVSWSPPTDKQNLVDSYMVEWRDNGNSLQSGSSLVLRETTYTISSNLTSGRAYTVMVISRNRVDYTSIITTTYVTKEQAIKPQTPGAINTGSSDLNVVNKTIFVVWTGSAGDVREYEWKLQDGNTELISGTTASLSTNINYSEIKNGYRYAISITALSQPFGGRTIRSGTHTEEIKTVVTVPSSPQQVECHMTTDSSITIKWSASLQPNGDLIDYKIDTYRLGSDAVLKTNRTGSLALMYEITGLQPGSYYYFGVSTVNELYTSMPTRLTPSYCATRANVSDMPNNLIVSEVQSRSLMVSWTKPTNTYGDNMGYVVQVRTADNACVMELIRKCSDCTQLLNSSALENMCPNEHSSSDQLSMTSINTDDKQMYNVKELNPYVNYTIIVTAVNAAGRGNVAQVIVQTDEEVPQKPKEVNILDITSKSCNVAWNIDEPRPGVTLWDIIVDPASPVLEQSIQLEGFSQTQQTLNDLQEFWNYTITIKATTSKGSSLSDPVLFTTLQAAPGPVDSFNVETSPGGSTVQVQWKIPTLLERNSEIARFSLSHNTSSDRSMQEISLGRNSNDEYVYDVMLNVTPEMTYQFKVYAINADNETGEEDQITIEAPAGIPFNSFEIIDNKSVIPAEAIVPSQTTLKLSINKGFYDQNSSGSVQLTGLIGCAKDKCSENEIGSTMTVVEFNTVDNWHTASARGFIKYRITRADWRKELFRKRRKRQADTNTEEFIVGAEMCNDSMKTQYCNGPLQPATSYIIHAVICTNGGCLISNEYGPFTTLDGPSDDDDDSTYVVIVAVIISIVVVASIVAAVVFVTLRKKKTTGKRQTAKIPQSQESHDDESIGKHQNAFEFSDVTQTMTNIEVMAWLNANDFKDHKQHFKKYKGKDLLALSKDDVARICGAADGIRLFNRMREWTVNNVAPLRVSESDINTHYADLDETTRNCVPYENIDLNEAHMYSSLNYQA